MNNPETTNVLEALHTAGDELREIVLQKDHTAFREIFESVHNHFGDFSEQALSNRVFLLTDLSNAVERHETSESVDPCEVAFVLTSLPIK